MYNPLTESPLNLWQTSLNIQNILKLKAILIKAESIKFWFATRAQHIIWAIKIHLTTESDQFSMENLAKKKTKLGGGTFQKQVCLGLTTADNRQLMFNLMNGSFYDTIIRSDTIPSCSNCVSVDCSEMVYNLTYSHLSSHLWNISHWCNQPSAFSAGTPNK